MDGAVAALLHDSGREADLYAARQFENPRNVFAHQHSTGPELIQQVGVRLDGFVAGVGTGGTLMGVAHALRDHGYDTIIARAMPTATFTAEGDPEVVGGIPGIVEGMSQLLDPDAVGLEDPVLVPEPEAMATAREFGRRGLGIGPSSGLNIAAARRLADPPWPRAPRRHDSARPYGAVLLNCLVRRRDSGALARSWRGVVGALA